MVSVCGMEIVCMHKSSPHVQNYEPSSLLQCAAGSSFELQQGQNVQVHLVDKFTAAASSTLQSEPGHMVPQSVRHAYRGKQAVSISRSAFMGSLA